MKAVSYFLSIACVVTGATHELKVFDPKNFANIQLLPKIIQSSINRLYSNGGGAYINYEQCEDDLGIFTFDVEST